MSDIVRKVSLPICGSAVHVSLGRFFGFLIHTQSVGLLDVGSAHHKAVTYTQYNTNIE
jgi:hypothetical protein